MHISVQMTIHFFVYGFTSCTFLYECWDSCLNIPGCDRFSMRQSYFCTDDYPYSFLMGLCHAHFSTNDYPFLCVWVYVMHISLRMTIHILFVWVFFMHISVRISIHFFLNRFSSCTSLYEWLSIIFLDGVLSCTFIYE